MAITDSTAERFTAQDPDVRLMLKVRDDDADAFAELMARYQSRLVSLMMHQLGRRDMAEDLAQEVFLRVYRARKRYIPGSKFSTWLYTIANNVSLNARRGLARRKEVHVTPADSGEVPRPSVQALAASGLMPQRQIDSIELREVVKVAIAELGERQRMAVLLNKFEHLSYEEIAEVMDLTPQAVKSLLSRARMKLKEILEPYLEHGQGVAGAS